MGDGDGEGEGDGDGEGEAVGGVLVGLGGVGFWVSVGGGRLVFVGWLVEVPVACVDVGGAGVGEVVTVTSGVELGSNSCKGTTCVSVPDPGVR